MTTTEINRKLHQALGKYWFKHCPQENPDYCADPRLVIEAMGEKGHWIKFLMSLLEYSEYEPEIYIGTVDGVISLIMDKTGKLAMLALEWLKEAKYEL